MHGEVEALIERFEEYIAAPPAIGRADRPAAYFCAEFGIHEAFPVYAGGLGILAGDHCKSASDQGVPLVGIGLLYREGYFTQLIDRSGRQRAYYERDDFDRMGLEPILTEGGAVQLLSIPGPEHEIQFRVWRSRVGRVTLYLMDTDVAGNRTEDRALTQRLYGGGKTNRIRQEILLGIGGVRTLRHLGIEPSVYHMNEGHCGFLALELCRELIAEGATFADASATVRGQAVFTTHTPVPAGHDRFDPAMMEHELGWLREALGLDQRAFLGLGRVHVHDDHETFCMTVLGLKMSRAANGVSKLHGAVSRSMWAALWPDRPVEQVPIGHVTNGVHVPTWIAPEMADLLDSHLGDGWRRTPWEAAVWDGVDEIPDSVLWAVHQLLKRRLLEYSWEKVTARRLQRHVRGRIPAMEVFNSEALTIGFARRFATYKRGDLLFKDIERARRVLGDPDRPIQLIFAGKAHPQDIGGGDVLQRVVLAGRDPVLRNNVMFLDNYGIDVARYLVQGVDVWLNNPRRPREASGTSGQKVPLNGGINASTVDGWWCEGYEGDNGWNIGDERDFSSHEEHDRADLEALYYILQQEIAPLYYRRDPDGIPRGWVKKMKSSLKSVARAFNSDRMILDYANQFYWPS